MPSDGGGGGGAGAPWWLDPKDQLRGVNSNVLDWMNQAAATSLPKGWKIEVSAGPYNHSQLTYQGGVSQVPKGEAVDVYLVDDQGNRVPHPLHLDPSSTEYQTYQKMGNAYIEASGGQGRWGGYYSDPDVMQFGTVVPGEYPRGSRAPASLYAGGAAVGAGLAQAVPAALAGGPPSGVLGPLPDFSQLAAANLVPAASGGNALQSPAEQMAAAP